MNKIMCQVNYSHLTLTRIECKKNIMYKAWIPIQWPAFDHTASLNGEQNKRNCILLSICHYFFFCFWLLVGCSGFNGPLRQYFSLYRAVFQREGKTAERIDESKNIQTTPTRTYCKRNRPLPYSNPNCRTPRHWKFTQHHRTTRPPPFFFCKK